MSDPILAEIRAIRDKIAAEFNYDPKAYFEYLQQCQRESGATYVTLPRRPPDPSAMKWLAEHRKPNRGCG